MAQIDATTNSPPIQPADGDHTNHGVAAGAAANTGMGFFADTLSQAIGQPAPAPPYGDHGGASSGGPSGTEVKLAVDHTADMVVP